MGYYQAAHDLGIDLEIVGVDIAQQKHYPFKFIRADAMTFPLAGYDFIHASPPCQEYSTTRHLRKALHPHIPDRPMLIGDMYRILRASGAHWIIENVANAPMPDSTVLCGKMFGLPIKRHRLFAASLLLFAPYKCHHKRNEPNLDIIGGKVRGYGALLSETMYRCHDGSMRKRESAHKKIVGMHAMGINWMTLEEMSESIPPIYTRYLGRQMFSAMQQIDHIPGMGDMVGK